MTDAYALCAAIRDELAARTGRGGEIVFGPALETSDIPQARHLRARGAHFLWVALPLRGVPFWEAHVGVVVDPVTLRARSGIHRAASSEIGRRLFAALEPEREALALETSDAALAEEVQYLGWERDLPHDAAIAALCEQAESVLTWAETASAALRPQERNDRS
ncbi:MAG TPA: hypothetical protein VNJ51_02935 [Candidatus Dormibacteraeota bacterium]|nr:hypothetical protein [Candidatus Dormibacteraeota bacterium]